MAFNLALLPLGEARINQLKSEKKKIYVLSEELK